MGSTWKVDSVRHLNRSPLNFGPPLPTGTVLTVITVDRSGPPADEADLYGVITDGERTLEGRRRRRIQSNPPDDGVTSMCSKPGLLQFTFLLPQDVVPTAIDVTKFDGEITVRMLL